MHIAIRPASWIPAIGVILALIGCQLNPATEPGGISPNHNLPGPAPKEQSELLPQRYAVTNDYSINQQSLPEISGMTVANRSKGVLWAVNDSGHPPRLHAISTRGKPLLSLDTSVRNRDWEAMTGFVRNGDAWLLLADTGDNRKIRDSYQLHLFKEPLTHAPDHRKDSEKDTREKLEPVSTIEFRYPDGSHDCEAIAVSEPDNLIILITKESVNPGIYALPLPAPGQSAGQSPGQSPGKDPETAIKIGTLADIPQSATDRFLGKLTGIDLSLVTDVDIDQHGLSAHVLTYRGIYRWRRHVNSENVLEDWGTTFSRPAELIRRHTLTQAEALAISRSTGVVFVTSERLPAPLWRLTPF